MSVGFSPCFTQPLPSVTCRRSSPAVPGARVLFVSSKAVSIYRLPLQSCGRQGFNYCDAPYEAEGLRVGSVARLLRGPAWKKLWAGVSGHLSWGGDLGLLPRRDVQIQMTHAKDQSSPGHSWSRLSPSRATTHQKVLTDQASETALFDRRVILPTACCGLDISLAYMLQVSQCCALVNCSRYGRCYY